MIIKIYCLYDSKAQFYHAPFFLLNDELAVRGFAQAANDSETFLGKNPGDYTLFSLGEFDDSTGSITTLKTPHNLGLALNYRRINHASQQISNETPVLASAKGGNSAIELR